MSSNYKINDQFGMYYITFATVEWIDVFTRKRYSDIAIGSLNTCIEKKGLIVYAWVIMSNHLHLIVRSETGDLSGTIRDFKKYTSGMILQSIRDEPESRRNWMNCGRFRMR